MMNLTQIHIQYLLRNFYRSIMLIHLKVDILPMEEIGNILDIMEPMIYF